MKPSPPILFAILVLLVASSRGAEPAPTTGRACYFFTASWCAKCPAMYPLLEQLNREGRPYLIRDVDEWPGLFKRYKDPASNAVPQFVAVNNDRVRARAVGVQRIETLRALWGATAAATAGAAPVAEQARAAAEVRQYVARISTSAGDGASFSGSGVLVDVDEQGRGVVLTNAHVIAGRKGPVLVSLAAGQYKESQVVDVDSEWDLAALVVPNVTLKPVALADTVPTLGERVTIVGWGGGQYREASGNVGAFWAPTETSANEFMAVTVVARQGDSGGPMLNTAGRLVGVLSRGDRSTCGCHTGPIRRFLARLRSRLHPRLAPIPPRESNPPAASPSPGHLNPQPGAPSAPTYPPPGPQPTFSDPPSVASDDEHLGPTVAPSSPPSDDEELDESASSDGTASGQDEPLVPPVVEQGEPSSPPSSTRPIARARAKIRGAIVGAAERKITTAGTAGLTAFLVSVGLPAGAAGLVAGGVVYLVMRRAHKKLAARIESGEQSSSSRVIEILGNLRSGVVEHSRLKLQQVPTVNADYEALLESMAREVKVKPQLGPYAERILATFKQLRGESVHTDSTQELRPSDNAARQWDSNKQAEGRVLGWQDKQ